MFALRGGHNFPSPFPPPLHSLVCSPSELTAGDWAKRMIIIILQVLARLMTVLKYIPHSMLPQGYLKLRQRMMVEIDQLSQLAPLSPTESSNFMLEMDQQCSWLHSSAFPNLLPNKNTEKRDPSRMTQLRLCDDN